METINSVTQVMVIFQRLYLFSFIKKCSKISISSSQIKYSKVGFKLYPTRKKKKNISNVSKHFILQRLPSPSIDQEVSPAVLRLLKIGCRHSEFLKHCWDSAGWARTAHSPEMGARAHVPNAHNTPCQGVSTLIIQDSGESAETPERARMSRFLLCPLFSWKFL